MKEQFHTVAHFLNVIAYIDCTHVKISTPSVNKHKFVKRQFTDLHAYLVKNWVKLAALNTLCLVLHNYY